MKTINNPGTRATVKRAIKKVLPTKKLVKPVGFIPVSLGCDPEFFLEQNGKIIGSEKVIPKNGIITHGFYSNPGIIRDGVQVELNPPPHQCRQSLNVQIQQQMHNLYARLADKNFSDVKISEKITVELSDEEMNSLSDESKILGCNRSHNVYDKNATVGVEDSTKFNRRSAGGHIHLGVGTGSLREQHLKMLQDADRVVPILDIVVGNTCVLLDRDEGNKLRRLNYGRAGEYRLPKHGIEYRTLSNFWMRDPILASIVFGLARQAVRIVLSSTEDNDYARELFKLVDITEVEKAINENDFDLAMSNYNKIKQFLIDYSSDNPAQYQGGAFLTSKTIRGFEKLIKVGINSVFSRNMMANWLCNSYNRWYDSQGNLLKLSREGAESFLVDFEKVKI